MTIAKGELAAEAFYFDAYFKKGRCIEIEKTRC
jgi:hypothetical protein